MNLAEKMKNIKLRDIGIVCSAIVSLIVIYLRIQGMHDDNIQWQLGVNAKIETFSKRFDEFEQYRLSNEQLQKDIDMKFERLTEEIIVLQTQFNDAKASKP